jgi:G3E family GTPase
VLDRSKFAQLIASLPPEIYRAKGFVRLDSGSYLFNYVAGRTDLEEFSASLTQLVFIGPRLESVRGSIVDQLRGCEV